MVEEIRERRRVSVAVEPSKTIVAVRLLDNVSSDPGDIEITVPDMPDAKSSFKMSTKKVKNGRNSPKLPAEFSKGSLPIPIELPKGWGDEDL